MFLVAEQNKLERLNLIGGGMPIESDDVDILVMQYAMRQVWPKTMAEKDRQCIVQRFEWARILCATIAMPARKADGTQTVSVEPPAWNFEDMMIWLLVEAWGLTYKFSKFSSGQQLPPKSRPEPPPSLN
jgi:hypothetical protein